MIYDFGVDFTNTKYRISSKTFAVVFCQFLCTLNGHLTFEKGFGKLLKSCTKRYPRDQSSFPRKLCCWPLRGKSYGTPVFSDLPQIEAGLQTDKIQKGSSPCEVLKSRSFSRQNALAPSPTSPTQAEMWDTQ